MRTLTDNGQIRTQTFGQRPAGTVIFEGGRLLVRDGNLDDLQTGIFSDAEERSTGPGGTVIVTASDIRLEAGGQLRSVTSARARRAGSRSTRPAAFLP